MTERLGGGDTRRGVARITLGLLVAAIAILGLTTVYSPLRTASAQGAEPTATRTATGGSTSPGAPASPTGTQIQFVNPSKYASPEYVSIKPDVDERYHLVAWVHDAPANARVEFEIQPSGQNPQPIGAATRVGADTFELFWNLANVPDGSYTLIANLYDGDGQSPSPTGSPSASPSPSPSPSGGADPVASDSENVNVDRTRETVEILAPANGGELGRYDPDGNDGPRRPGFTLEVAKSENADNVRVYYSTSPPGTEPSWVTCNQQVTVAYSDDTNRIGCTIPESADPITAVAAVAVENVPQSGTSAGPVCTPPLCTPASTRTESGDAHRVTQYTVDPSSMTVTPESSSAPRTTCVELTATVRDDRGRFVWRANVDVHATGPGDTLQFGETENTDPFKAPEGGNHSGTELTYDCEASSNGSSQNQAEHSRFQAADDKHIESEVNPDSSGSDPRPEGATQEGTDLEGEFVFALRSPDAGSTIVLAWADEDDDDVNDNQNAQGQSDAAIDAQDGASIVWTQQTASPSPSTSASTSSPSPTNTQTTTTSSPSGTASTTPSSASPTPVQSLNCEPETDTNPVGSTHTLVCTVSEGSSPRSGVSIDVEATGANDFDGDSRNTPDFTCRTSGESGSCTITHGPGGTGSTGSTGTTIYRAWIDADDGNAVAEDDQTEGINEFQQPGQRPEPDNTDVVEKTWRRAPLDCTPEQDGNPTGTSHTITCRASGAEGNPVPTGTRIHAEATGTNDPDSGETLDTPDFQCTTDQQGVCSFTHGPGGNGSTNFEGVTRYRAWIDADNSNANAEADRTEGRDEGSQPGTVPESDETDVVEKTWTREPRTLTMEPQSDSASVGTCNPYTITVLGENGQAVAGVLVDVEQRHERAGNQTGNDEPRVGFCRPTGTQAPNPSGVDQTQGDLDPPDENPDNLGTAGGEALQPTDSSGRVTVGITVEPANGSDGSGTVTLTAFFETDDDQDPEAGEPQDSSTKSWVVAEGRTIACLPEAATNPANTQHTVTCTVRDRFGDPVEGEGVTFTEEGAGDFASRGTRTDSNGQIRAVTTSSTAGTQTITATLDRDLQGAEPGEVDECDRPAGSPENAPQGACSDSVTKTWTAATSAPAQFGREVTIEAQKGRVVFRKNVTLAGAVESDAEAPAACTDFVQVNILRDVVGGANEFELFATEQTDANGAYSHSFRGDVSANYVAEVEEVAQCDAATSDAEPVLVKVKVSLRISDTKVPRGTRVRFTVRTAPCPATAGDRVLLFRAIEGEFGKVGSKRTNDRCRKTFRNRVRRESVFQARWPKQAEEFLAGKSRAKIVRVRGR